MSDAEELSDASKIIAGLVAKIDRLRETIDANDLTTCELIADRDRLKSENERLRLALKGFGKHSYKCSTYCQVENKSCDCGLESALAATEGKDKE